MLKKLWNWLQLYLSIQDAVVWGKALFPFISAGGLVVLGYLEAIPAMYIGLAALGGFALAAHGMNALSDWQKRHALLYKFKFHDIGFQYDTADGKPDGDLVWLQPAFEFENLGDRPLSIRVTRFDWRIENRVPMIPWPTMPSFEAEPLTLRGYRGQRIQVDGLDLTEWRSGLLTIDLLYGPRGRERHPWTHTWNVFISRTEDPETNKLQLHWKFEEPTVPQPGVQQALPAPS